MIKVTVTDPSVRNMTGNAKGTGKHYDLNFQWVWLHLFNRAGQADPYPTKLEIILEKDKEGAALFYAPREYVLHPSSLYVADGKLAVAPRLALPTAPPKQAT